MRRYRPTKSKHIGDYVLNGRNTKDIGDYEAILKTIAVTVSLNKGCIYHPFSGNIANITRGSPLEKL